MERLLVKRQGEISKPLFPTREDYEKFREDFCNSVKPELDRQQKARMESELRARYHIVD